MLRATKTARLWEGRWGLSWALQIPEQNQETGLLSVGQKALAMLCTSYYLIKNKTKHSSTRRPAGLVAVAFCLSQRYRSLWRPWWAMHPKKVKLGSFWPAGWPLARAPRPWGIHWVSPFIKINQPTNLSGNHILPVAEALTCSTEFQSVLASIQTHSILSKSRQWHQEDLPSFSSSHSVTLPQHSQYLDI